MRSAFSESDELDVFSCDAIITNKRLLADTLFALNLSLRPTIFIFDICANCSLDICERLFYNVFTEKRNNKEVWSKWMWQQSIYPATIWNCLRSR